MPVASVYSVRAKLPEYLDDLEYGTIKLERQGRGRRPHLFSYTSTSGETRLVEAAGSERAGRLSLWVSRVEAGNS